MRKVAVCAKCNVEVAYEIDLVEVEDLRCPECAGLVVVGRATRSASWGA